MVNEVTFVLKFELITNVILNFTGQTFALFFIYATWPLNRAKYGCLAFNNERKVADFHKVRDYTAKTVIFVL